MLTGDQVAPRGPDRSRLVDSQEPRTAQIRLGSETWFCHTEQEPLGIWDPRRVTRAGWGFRESGLFQRVGEGADVVRV